MFNTVRADIQKYFNEQGHSRTPEDYANRWLLDNLPGKNRDESMIKTSLRRALKAIADEVMSGEIPSSGF